MQMQIHSRLHSTQYISEIEFRPRYIHLIYTYKDRSILMCSCNHYSLQKWGDIILPTYYIMISYQACWICPIRSYCTHEKERIFCIEVPYTMYCKRIKPGESRFSCARQPRENDKMLVTQMV